MKKLYILCGLPASGKSTWVKSRIKDTDKQICISRDEIRFAYIKDKSEYFDYESKIYKEYIKKIQAALDNPPIEEVYADATHITDGSRNKLLKALTIDEDTKVIYVVFPTTIQRCIERDSLRKGLAQVGAEVIKNMAKNFTIPKEKELIFIDDLLY